MLARDLCLALDLPIVAKNTENIRSKLNRLVCKGIFVETEAGLFAQPRPCLGGEPPGQPVSPNLNDERGINSRTALSEAKEVCSIRTRVI
ncbi:hypothetical protein [Nonomuraea dietziae]|uniref:hypothetical protein n=1 Tax=Nonomuraea dietziae TaxID=65515 RepID=UPI0033EDB832